MSERIPRNSTEGAEGRPQERRHLIHSDVEHELEPLLAEDVVWHQARDAGPVEERLHRDDSRVVTVVARRSEHQPADVGVADVSPLAQHVVSNDEGGKDVLRSEGLSQQRLAGDAVEEREEEGLRTHDAADVLDCGGEVMLFHGKEKQIHRCGGDRRGRGSGPKFGTR